MLSRAIHYFFPPPIRERAGLATFMSGEAAYLAQRSTYEFTRNTLAWHGQAAFGDAAFNDAFRICRWEAFAAILSGFSVICLPRLSFDPNVEPTRLIDAMTRLYAGMLADYQTPTHRESWTDMHEALAQRLRDLDPAAPSSIPTVARIAAARVYESIPVRAGNTQEERAVIENAIRFGVIGFAERLDKRLRPVETLGSLLAA